MESKKSLLDSTEDVPTKSTNVFHPEANNNDLPHIENADKMSPLSRHHRYSGPSEQSDLDQRLPSLIIPDDSNDDSSENLIFVDNDKTNEEKKRLFYSDLCKGYVVVSIGILSLTLGIVTSEMTFGIMTIFELNIGIFILQTLASLPAVIIPEHKFKINWQHWYLLIVAAASNYITIICYFSVPEFLPFEISQGLFMTFYIAFALTVDILAERVNKTSIIAGIITCGGLILIAQPWIPFEELKQKGKLTPCQTLGKRYSSGNDTPEQLLAVCTDGDDASSNNCTTSASIETEAPEEQLRVSFFGIEIDTYLFGYLLLIVASINATAFGNFIRLLGQIYPVPAAMFWISFLEIIISITIAVVTGNWDYPQTYWCVLLLVAFIILNVILNFSTYYFYHYLHISQAAITLTIAVILFYICQRTFMSSFYNVWGNIIETVGTFLIIAGVMLTPTLLIVSSQNPYTERQKISE